MEGSKWNWKGSIEMDLRVQKHGYVRLALSYTGAPMPKKYGALSILFDLLSRIYDAPKNSYAPWVKTLAPPLIHT